MVSNTIARTWTEIGFTVSGGLLVSKIDYISKSFTQTATATVNTMAMTQISAIDIAEVTEAVTEGSSTIIEFEGILRNTAAGGIRPVIVFSPAAGTANVMKVGSFVEFEELGPATMFELGKR